MKKYYTYSTQAIIFNVVDKTPPTIKISSKTIEINVGSSINILDYISISDDSCEQKELDVIFDDSFVLYNMVGTYDASVTVKDKYNNSSKASITIKIVDKVKPELLVQKPLILSVGQEIDLKEYFIATDNKDGDLTSLIKIGGLDINKIGNQEITVSVSDYSKNLTTITVEVTVIDNLGPYMLLSSQEVKLDIKNYSDYDSKFFQKYITDYSDNSTNKEDIVIEIDTSNLKEEVGDFELYFLAKDLNDNVTEKVLIVKLRELEGPVLESSDSIDINLYEDIDLESLVTVIDHYDIEAKDRLEVLETDFDNKKVGTYYVKYICYNSSGEYTEKTIEINVIDDENKLTDSSNNNNSSSVSNNNSNNNQMDNNDKGFIDSFFAGEINQESILTVSLIVLVFVLLVVVFKKENKE